MYDTSTFVDSQYVNGDFFSILVERVDMGESGIYKLGTMKYSDKILNLCERRGWSQAELARVAGYSKSTVSNWCSGKRTPDMKAGLKLSRLFDVDLEWLADDGMDEQPPDLSDVERQILDAARIVTYDLALKRIMAAPEQAGQPGQFTMKRSGGKLIDGGTDARRPEDEPRGSGKSLP